MSSSARQLKRAKRLDKRIMKSMRFDLRSPCSDCPFRTDAPMHEGIIAEIHNKLTAMDDAALAHSCHQTDPRADCAPEKRVPKGSPVQHCAGALIMQRKMGDPQLLAAMAEAKGLFKPERLNMEAPVFSSKKKMLLHYIPGLLALLPHHPQAGELRSLAEQMRSTR